MDATTVGELLFRLGAVLATGFLLYGGWLSVRARKVEPESAASRRDTAMLYATAGFVMLMMLVLQ